MPKAAKAKVGDNKKPIHPNSRKAQQLSRKVFRDIRIEKGKAVRNKYDLLAAKLIWFRDNLIEEKETYTKEDICELTVGYLNRFEDELEQIEITSNIGGRRGNQHASRETAIKFSMENEKSELDSCGIEVPDLVNKETLKTLRSWEGEIKYVQNFKLKKIKQVDIDKVAALKAESKMTESDSDSQ